jgi:Ca2+-transporting ATPase
VEIYNKNTQEVLDQFDSSDKGLTVRQYEDRLKKYGKNLVKIKGVPLYKRLIEPFANIFILILLVAVVISIFQSKYLDAVVTFLIIMVSAIISYVQDFSSARLLKSLRKHDRQKVQVIRDGNLLQVDTEMLVPGDTFFINEGDKVPVDARIIHSEDLRCDESILTGESIPVSKQSGPLSSIKEIYEQTNMVFQGTFVVGGRAKAIAVATGNNTESGKLAKLTVSTQTSSPVQAKIDKLVSQIVVAVFAAAAVAFGLSLLRGIELEESIRFVLSLTVSAVPEGLPVAVSVVLVIGMRRMASKHALVRNMSAIENIGLVTQIATDKTGTLTKNKLTVQDVWQLKDRDLRSTSHFMVDSVNSKDGVIHDPLDLAILDFAKKYSEKGLKDNPEKSFPFDISLAMSGNLWKTGDSYELVLKGAPEKIIEKCDLSETVQQTIKSEILNLTGQAYRVIALAYGEFNKPVSKLYDVKKGEVGFEALIAIADEIRPESNATIKQAINAGVKVCMITGDHFETAFAIGKKLGLVEKREQVFDTRKIDKLSDAELESLTKTVRVFSRVVPENKYRLLEAFKKYEITAMTGDGVNDVPALSSAHVGVAIGSGSQIAKDASDIVLLDSNFKSIVSALKEGRQIYDNIRRMLFYLLSTNLGEVIISLSALSLGLPLPMLPLQILWVNIVTDTCLVIPLGVEPPSGDVLDAPPRRVKKPILGRRSIARLLVIAASMSLIGLAVFAIYLQNHSVEYARTIAFTVIVGMQWANAFNARSEWKSLFGRNLAFNGYFMLGLAAAFIMQLLVLFGPFKQAFYAADVSILDLVVSSTIGFVLIIITDEIFKLFYKRRKRSSI